MLESFVFGPRIDAVKDDAFLAGGDEIFGLGNGLANYPILAFGLANHFAEFTLVVGAVFDAAFFHFFVNHTTKVDFGNAVLGKIVNGDGFAGTAHTDDGDNLDVFGI